MLFHRFAATRRLTSLALLFSLCLLHGGACGTRAQLLSGLTQTTTQTLTQTTQTLAQVVKVSPDLLRLITTTPAMRRVPVVVQSSGLWGLTLDLLLATLGARTTRTYQNFNARALELPAGNVLLLATSSLVSFVSADRPVLTLGHLSTTTGADTVREESGTSATLDGTGIGVAVIDSGVYAGHKSFLDKSNRVRVVRSVDFKGEGRTDDPFGHGSHVAGVATGNGRVSGGLREGFWQTWRRYYLWTSVMYFAGAAGAGLLARLVAGFGFYPVAAAAPVAAIVYFTYQTYLKSVETAATQAAMAERHVQELNRYLAEQERISRQLEESREHFRAAALHDALTGLPNRTLLMNHLKLAVEHSKRRPDYRFAALFLDLDRFKVINDSLGHIAGDHLLVQLARRLEECIRTPDTVARLGGDEFAILLSDIEDYADAVRVAERIHVELARPFHLGGHEVYTSASIGITLSATGYNDPETILRDADTVMYRAKANGKARHELFDEAMHARAVALLRTENDLRRAVERDEFRVVYQPILSLLTGEVVGFESLVRWHHPERGVVSPAEFIPVAEETGLIVEIGRRVLRESCRQLSEWQARGLVSPAHYVSVNLSGKQFAQAGLAASVAEALSSAALNPRCLRLEITESVVMSNAEATCATLGALRAQGLGISIDDFGTGYSSLSYLHRFPVDTLKVDRSFIGRMGEGDENGEIVRTIITLARNLGMAVVAEGVETARQGDLLRGLGCEYAQGYFFSRPLDPAAAARWLLIEAEARP